MALLIYIIDWCKNTERQVKACNSVVISCKISLQTSLCMVTFPFLIVRNTFSLHILSNFFNFYSTQARLF